MQNIVLCYEIFVTKAPLNQILATLLEKAVTTNMCMC